MALVSCRECGSEVSDSAVTCPKCGVAGPAGDGRLVVARRKKFANGGVRIDVRVDGVQHASLRSGQEAHIILAPGKYTLELSSRGNSTRAAVEIKSRQTLTCVVDLSAMGSVRATLD